MVSLWKDTLDLETKKWFEAKRWNIFSQMAQTISFYAIEWPFVEHLQSEREIKKMEHKRVDINL